MVDDKQDDIEVQETVKPDLGRRGMVTMRSYKITKVEKAKDKVDLQKVTELIFAAGDGDLATVVKLITEGGVDPNIGGERYSLPRGIAFFRMPNRLFVPYHTIPFVIDYDQRTALHVASGDGHMEVVEALLNNGADPNVVDRWSETPLDGAMKYHKTDMAKYLVSKGGKTGDIKATSLLLINAVSEQDMDTIKIILEIGHDPNVADYDKRTPLHIAVAIGNLEIAQMLIEKGADVHALDRFGGSPLTDAEAKAPRFGPDAMRDYLLDNGGREFKDVEDDNKVDVGLLLVTIQVIFFILFGIFVRYGDGPSGNAPADSALEVRGLYPHFQDVHVMIFIGFGMLMLFLKKYAYSAISNNMMLSIIMIQWHILVGGFFYNAFHGHWEKIHLSLTTFVLADFATASVLITFGACLGKVTKPSQLIVIGLLEIIFFTINEEIGKTLEIVDIGGSMVVHAFGAYFGLAVSYILTTPEARSHPDNGANYTSDVFAMVGSLFLWMFWPSFNSALAGPYDQERVIINTILSLTASGTASFAASYILRGEKRFDMVDIQNATLAGGVAVGTCANMMLGPVGAQVIGFLAGWLSVAGYVIIQPKLEEKLGVYDSCGVHNLHGMPGVLAGICSIVVSAIASIESYNTEGNFEAVFPYGIDPGRQAGNQAIFLVVTLAMAVVCGLITGKTAQFCCGKLQPRVYNDDNFFVTAFR